MNTELETTQAESEKLFLPVSDSTGNNMLQDSARNMCSDMLLFFNFVYMLPYIGTMRTYRFGAVDLVSTNLLHYSAVYGICSCIIGICVIANS